MSDFESAAAGFVAAANAAADEAEALKQALPEMMDGAGEQRLASALASTAALLRRLVKKQEKQRDDSAGAKR